MGEQNQFEFQSKVDQFICLDPWFEKCCPEWSANTSELEEHEACLKYLLQKGRPSIDAFYLIYGYCMPGAISFIYNLHLGMPITNPQRALFEFMQNFPQHVPNICDHKAIISFFELSEIRELLRGNSIFRDKLYQYFFVLCQSVKQLEFFISLGLDPKFLAQSLTVLLPKTTKSSTGSCFVIVLEL